MIEHHITENHGHPWDATERKGFDLLEARATTEEELKAFVAESEKSFWKPWLVGNMKMEDGLYGAAMFKPSGIMKDWDDSPENKHPGIILTDRSDSATEPEQTRPKFRF